MTKDKMIENISKHVAAYAKDTGIPNLKDDRDGVIRDILTDLMHYCQAHGVSFDEELDSARYHFNEESVEGFDTD